MNHTSYERPHTLGEAFEAKRRAPTARWVAGGTDLFVQQGKARAEGPVPLISLRRIEELRRIETGAQLRIGAAAPLFEIARHAEVAASFPALVQAIEAIGSRQIRNVATLAGNLCNASPGADAAPPLLVYGARVELQSLDGTRELELDEFFRGPGSTALAEDELLTAVLLDSPAAGSSSIFLRKGRVAMDIATASVALHLESDGQKITRARAAAGAVAPVPLRLRKVEALLTGAEVDAALLEQAQRITMDEIAPISDLRASADYRRKLTGVLLRRALESVFPHVRPEVLVR